MKTYLVNLITEKGRELDDNINCLNEIGHFGVTYEMLVDYIAAAKEYHSQIRKTLVTIDFKNGDIFHYLDFLAKGMIAATYP